VGLALLKEGGLVGRGGMGWKLGEIMGLDQDQVCQRAHETLGSVFIFPNLLLQNSSSQKKILVQDSDGGLAICLKPVMGS
jgi:hypothetical protein